MSENILGIFNGSDIEGLTALIDKLEKSSFDFMKLEGGGVKIVIGKNGACEATQTAAPAAVAAPVPVPAPIASAPAAEAIPETAAPVAAAAPAAVAAVSSGDGIIVVKSPSYGIFYAQSEPGAPVYVSIGSTVKKGDTLGLLEIMKTFNAISSEVEGEVVGIHVKNQEVLEPEQPLFSIKVK